MKYFRLLLFLPLVIALFVICANENDEVDIQALLESSWYVGDGALESANDSTNIPKGINGNFILADTWRTT